MQNSKQREDIQATTADYSRLNQQLSDLHSVQRQQDANEIRKLRLHLNETRNQVANLHRELKSTELYYSFSSSSSSDQELADFFWDVASTEK